MDDHPLRPWCLGTSEPQNVDASELTYDGALSVMSGSLPMMTRQRRKACWCRSKDHLRWCWWCREDQWLCTSAPVPWIWNLPTIVRRRRKVLRNWYRLEIVDVHVARRCWCRSLTLVSRCQNHRWVLVEYQAMALMLMLSGTPMEPLTTTRRRRKPQPKAFQSILKKTNL